MGKIFMPTEPLVRSPRMFEIAAGRVHGVSGWINSFSTTAGTTHTDFWNVDGDLVYLDAAETLSIVSDDADDADQGAGAWTVRVIGLDSDWKVQTEVVTLNGVTPVLTTKAFIRVWRIEVVTGGSNNEGTITATASVAGDIQAAIDPHAAQSAMSHFTPPVTHAAFVTAATVSVGDGKECNLHVHTKDNNIADSVLKLKRDFVVFENSLRIDLHFPRMIPPKVDYKWHVAAQVSSVEVSGDYSLLLVDINQVNIEDASPFLI